tara:strand:+ start:322 stop:768 length:447 start_codon:yes stop_codon:yes gene_type:complete
MLIVGSLGAQAKTMTCSGIQGGVIIDDLNQLVTVTGHRAIEVAELLLEGKNVYVDKITMAIDQSKIQENRPGGIAKIEAMLTPNSAATVFYINGDKEIVSLNGGFLSASFNPYYDIGMSGSLTVLKDGMYSRVSLYIPHLECIREFNN